MMSVSIQWYNDLKFLDLKTISITHKPAFLNLLGRSAVFSNGQMYCGLNFNLHKIK